MVKNSMVGQIRTAAPNGAGRIARQDEIAERRCLSTRARPFKSEIPLMCHSHHDHPRANADTLVEIGDILVAHADAA